MINWQCDFNKKTRFVSCIEDFDSHENLVGFVYKITNLKTGKFYIGKKSFFHTRKTAISKREKAQTGTKKRFKRVSKESNWLTYYGSCKELKDDIGQMGADLFKREILEVCCTKKYLGYCEVKHQIINDVLGKESYNGNILGRYYPKDIENCNK